MNIVFQQFTQTSTLLLELQVKDYLFHIGCELSDIVNVWAFVRTDATFTVLLEFKAPIKTERHEHEGDERKYKLLLTVRSGSDLVELTSAVMQMHTTEVFSSFSHESFVQSPDGHTFLYVAIRSRAMITGKVEQM